jgi:hypothetical protein
MSISVMILIGFLVVMGVVVAPVMLTWGWIRWVKLPKVKTVWGILSLAGFMLATASALLAIAGLAIANVDWFAYYDPKLMQILVWGVTVSLAGLLFAGGGVWRKSPLRWHALVSAFGTLCFWLLEAALQ